MSKYECEIINAKSARELRRRINEFYIDHLNLDLHSASHAIIYNEKRDAIMYSCMITYLGGTD